MKLLLVDDHAIVRAGLRQLLAAIGPVTVTEAGDGREALALLRRERPDVVVLDLNLPGIGGVELIRRLLRQEAGLRVLVLSMHAEPLYAARALQAGARGYVSKNAAPEELLTALRRVAAGERYIEAEARPGAGAARRRRGGPVAGPERARPGNPAAAGRRPQPRRNRGGAGRRLQDDRQRMQPAQGDTRGRAHR